MTGTALEEVLRRDRLVVAGALFVLAALAWSYVLWLAGSSSSLGSSSSIARTRGLVTARDNRAKQCNYSHFA